MLLLLLGAPSQTTTLARHLRRIRNLLNKTQACGYFAFVLSLTLSVCLPARIVIVVAVVVTMITIIIANHMLCG